MTQRVALTNRPPTSPSGPLRMCASCKKTQQVMQRCAGCLEVYYCNQSCQKRAWPEHKPVCKLALERITKRHELKQVDDQIHQLVKAHPYGDLFQKGMKREIPKEEFIKRMAERQSKMAHDQLEIAAQIEEILVPKYHQHARLREELENCTPLPSIRDTMKMIRSNMENVLNKPEIIPQHRRECMLKDCQMNLAFFNELENSPDREQIFKGCMDNQNQQDLEKALQETWSKLPPEEVKICCDAWEKIKPSYDKNVQAFERNKPSSEILSQLYNLQPERDTDQVAQLLKKINSDQAKRKS